MDMRERISGVEKWSIGWNGAVSSTLSGAALDGHGSVSPGGVWARREVSLHAAARPVKPNADDIGGSTEHHRDFPRRKTFPGAEKKDFAVSVGEARERPRDSRLEPGVCGRDGLPRCDELGSEPLDESRGHSALPKAFEQKVPRHAKEPRPGIVARWDRGQLLPGNEICLREEIGGELWIPATTHEVGEHVSVGIGEQPLKRGAVAGRAGRPHTPSLLRCARSRLAPWALVTDDPTRCRWV